MLRNNILLQKLPQPWRVQLPNGPIFFAKYQCVERHVLNPTRVRNYQTYIQKIGPQRQRIRKYEPRNKHRRKQQAGTGIDLSTAIDLRKKGASSSVGQMIINDAINALPTAYKKIKSKITNKKARAISNTGIDDFVLNKDVNFGESFN